MRLDQSSVSADRRTAETYKDIFIFDSERRCG